ncbi:MAG TPA: SIS domain-containing protein [Solirubrobacteraceae bacterium]|nr:SIS domain-containing protein [Solirubrobacteraceae bacterium]
MVTREYLAEEIAEQPAVVADLIAGAAEPVANAAAAARAARVSSVLVAARGTSDNVARYAQHIFGRLLRLPVALATPSLTTLYGASPRLERTLVIGISQSGESPDVGAVVADARAQGQPTIAVTNAPRSPLASAAEHVIDIGAGVERSVAATKTYTASLAAVALLAAALADDDALGEDLAAVPAAMAEQVARDVAGGARVLDGVDRCVVAGRGPNYATAFEGALKLKELTGVAAEPFSPADLMHGPLAVLEPATPLLAVAVAGPALDSVLAAVRAARERSAPCLVLADVPPAAPPGCEEIRLAPVAEWLSPLVAILPLQAIAARLARARGVAADAPFGLTKVTRTV